jgi:uncharacterized membrane protein YgdD (TMEM256/DUF423 family)
MPAPTASPDEALRAFLAARRKVIGHLIFIGICCVLAFILRKLLHLPTVMIGAVLLAGLAVFATDIFRMFLRRHELQRALRQTVHN